MASLVGRWIELLLVVTLLAIPGKIPGSMGFNLFKNNKNDADKRAGKPQHKLLAVVIDG